MKHRREKLMRLYKMNAVRESDSVIRHEYNTWGTETSLLLYKLNAEAGSDYLIPQNSRDW